MSDLPSRPSRAIADQRRMAELEEELARLQADRRDIRAREARFRILSELVTDCCWARWRSADGKVERAWVNEAFTEVTGYTPEEFEEIGREGLVHPQDLAKIHDFIDGPIGVSEHEFRIIRKDGQVRWLHERMRVREEGGGLAVFGATRDVTAQKQAERVLRDSHRQLEQRVAERTVELREVNHRLHEEVAERRQIEVELRQAKEAAEEASHAKSRFLATITHELRTPLHGIIGLADLLRRVELPSVAEEWMRALHTSAESLAKLVEEVLDFSKIEAGQLILETRPFSLHILAKDLRDVLEHRAAARGNQLEITIDERLPLALQGDVTRLRQVLINLLDNALKFTEDGRVTLAIEKETELLTDDGSEDSIGVSFVVHDTGIGFDEKARQRIFDPFTQADASTTRRFGGTGLGLAISRRLVDLLGGRLQAEGAPEAGATFFFTLPLAPATSVPAAAAAFQSFAVSHRILVAEDNAVNQMVVRRQLESFGFEVTLAGDGLQALAALAAGSFDVLLLDCHMPEMDGYETARRWRASEGNGRRLPIVAVTAGAIREELEACREAGMDDILTKPYRLEDLAAMLAKWLPARPDC